MELQGRGESVYLVAWDGERPIGWVLVHRPGSREASAHARQLSVAEIVDLQVAPPFQGHGHGSSLLAAAEQVARDGRCMLIGLEVTVSNPHNDVARAMYERHGYRDSGLGEFESGYFYWTESGERRWDGEPHRFLIKSLRGASSAGERSLGTGGGVTPWSPHRGTEDVSDLLPRYASLVGMHETTWGRATMRFRFEPLPPEASLLSNVRCAVFSNDRVLLIDTEEFGLSAFPGGTLEPDEAWMGALERELLEEAGARPAAVEVVGRLHFWSGSDAPYRPHLPHPEFHQLVAYAEGALVASPTNPPDGEHVIATELATIADAVSRLEIGNPFEAELLRFVAHVRERRSARRDGSRSED